MRKAFFLLLFLGAYQLTRASGNFTRIPGRLAADTTVHPSNEEFVNEIRPILMDTSFHSYYLFIEADPCRFIKFDYDEWEKYGLLEPLSIVIMNELAEKIYNDKGPYRWRQEQLRNAVCVGRGKVDSVLANRKRVKEDLIFFFSKPQFTDDGAYAVIDCNTGCGHDCGSQTTCIFKRMGKSWKMVGRHIY